MNLKSKEHRHDDVMSWSSRRLFVSNINFRGENFITIILIIRWQQNSCGILQNFDWTNGGKCSCLMFIRNPVRKRFSKEFFSHKIRWLLIRILVRNFCGKYIRWLYNSLRNSIRILVLKCNCFFDQISSPKTSCFPRLIELGKV